MNKITSSKYALVTSGFILFVIIFFAATQFTQYFSAKKQAAQIAATSISKLQMLCNNNSNVHTIDFTALDIIFEDNDVTQELKMAANCLTDQGIIILPAGTAILNEKISITNKSVTIRGAGLAATTLRWNNTQGGLHFTENRSPLSNKKMSSWQVEDLTLETSARSGGNAIRVENKLATRNTPSIIINRVMVRPNPDSSGYWTKSIYGTHARMGRISQSFFRGVNSGLSGTTHHIHLDGNSTNFTIESVHGMQSVYGVLIEDETEGVVITGSTFVSNAFGYTFNARDTGEPMIYIKNSHAASAFYPIWIKNGRSVQIQGHYVLRGDGPSGGSVYNSFKQAGKKFTHSERAVVHVEGQHALDITIDDSNLSVNDTSAGTDVSVISIDEGRRIRIESNTLRDAQRTTNVTGITIGPDVNGVIIDKNYFDHLAVTDDISPDARNTVRDY